MCIDILLPPPPSLFLSLPPSPSPSLFRLEVWPGFVTSILQYEQNVMLCADISHKILRTDTVLDVFFELKNEPKFHDAATRALVGEIVLTR